MSREGKLPPPRGKVEDIKESTSLAGVSIKMRPRVTNAIILYERYSHTAIVLHLHCSHNSLSRPFLCVCISFNAADEMVIRCAAATSFRFVSCGLVIRVYMLIAVRGGSSSGVRTLRSILESATRLTSLPRALHNYSARVDFLRKSHATW